MQTINEVCQIIHRLGGKPYFVGGCVRDGLLGIQPKDFDVEVFGLSPEFLKSTLEYFGEVNEVGMSFGVLKLRVAEGEVDFSIPRRDNKEGRGHKGFIAELDPSMTIEDAASRRDFSVNAIYKDAITGKIIDPCNGVEDLTQYQVLDPVGPAFREDPLRVLRGMQLASRFSLEESFRFEDYALMMLDEYNSLAIERIGEEWRKWCKGKSPSYGLDLLVSTGWITHYPELQDMISTPQDSLWHPEGWSACPTQDSSMGHHAFSLSFHPSCTSTAKSFGVNNPFTLRQFLTGTPTETTSGPQIHSTSTTQTGVTSLTNSLPKTPTTGTFDFNLSTSFSPAIETDPHSLVWSFGRPTVGTGEVVRVMFQIPLRRVKSIVSGAIDDFQVAEAIVHPVAVYVMNMLKSTKLASKFYLHDDSVNANSAGLSRSTRVSVPVVVVDARSASIDRDIICYFDLAVVRNVDTHDNSNEKEVNGTYVLTPSLCLEVEIGDAWIHTLHVCDAMAGICERENITGENREILMLAALCHDMGKPSTTIFKENRWRSPGHAQAGVPIAEAFLKSIGIFDRIIGRVLPLVAEHMFPSWEQPTRRNINRLKIRLGDATLEELLLLMEADHSGRPPLPASKPEGWERIVEMAADLPPKVEPLINGRHIIYFANGEINGKDIGKIKAVCFEAQLDELFTNITEAEFWTRRYMKENGYAGK